MKKSYGLTVQGEDYEIIPPSPSEDRGGITKDEYDKYNNYGTEIQNLKTQVDDIKLTVTASGSSLTIDDLQGGVPFIEISITGDDIIGNELTLGVNEEIIYVTPGANPYTITREVIQQDGSNILSISSGELSVIAVKRDDLIKEIYELIYGIKADYGESTINVGRKENTNVGWYSVAEGNSNVASGLYSHAEGYNNTASGSYSHAQGQGTTAYGEGSHTEGYYNTAGGVFSHAEGLFNIASNNFSHVCGKYSADMDTGALNTNTTGTAFVIGNGVSKAGDPLDESIITRSNAFSVQFNGTVKAASTITASTTADYAEFFEWLDNNPDSEDRVGYFVTLDEDKIRIASNDDDYILGVVSGEPFVLGNGDCDRWNGMYLRDEFRRTIYEPAPKVEQVEIVEEKEELYIDKETGEEKTRTVEVVVGHEYKEIEGEYEGTRPKLNPDYDNTKKYISRFERKEWAPVGMLGVLAVRHDGTAKINGYVTVNENGIATACDKKAENSYRVIKSNSESVVEIIFR